MTEQPPAVETAPPHRWWVLVVLAVGLGLIVLDGTIVGVSLPTNIDDLHLDLTTAQWVNGLYSVVFAALLLAAGKAGDRLGRRSRCSSSASSPSWRVRCSPPPRTPAAP